MFCKLPKDVLWLILKWHMTDILTQGIKLHNTIFACTRANRVFRSEYKNTCPYGDTVLPLYLVDYLYPLRLVCKKMNALLCEKVIRVAVNAGKGIKVMP